MHSREGWWRHGCALLALVLGACAGPGVGTVVARRGADAPPDATVQSILAPVRGDGLGELAWLQRLPASPANELRRAWVLTQIGDRPGALAVLNLLLYGDSQPSPAVEAMARYLRGTTYDLLGNPEEATADRKLALALAVDPELRALLEPTATEPIPDVPAPRAPRTASRPNVLPRSAWGARNTQPASVQPMQRPYRITIHHSAIATTSSSQRAAAAQILSVQRGHQTTEGWADIGYHFLIDRAGRVWEGRPLRWQGAHAGGDHNRGNIGVCLLGNFLRGVEGQEPTTEQKAALEATLRWLGDVHDIGPDQVFFHRQFKSTECPGPRLEAAVTDILRRMRQLAQR